MNNKLNDRLVHIIELVVILSMMMITNVMAAPVSGRVIEVHGDVIIINTGGGKVNIGDRVDISFQVGDEKLPIGTWHVTQVSGNRIHAKSERMDTVAQMGMTAEIFPAAGKADQQQISSTPAKENELFWLKEKKKTATQTSPQQTKSTATASTHEPIQTKTTNMYQLIWNDSGSGAHRDFASFRPLAEQGFYPLGDVAASEPWPGHRYAAPAFNTIMAKGGTLELKPPIGYKRVWSSEGSFSDKPFSSWAPEAPAGYKCLGDVGSQSMETMPSLNAIRCLPDQCVVETELNEKIWTDEGSGAKLDFSAWRIPTVNLYIGTASHGKPRGVFYTINPNCL